MTGISGSLGSGDLSTVTVSASIWTTIASWVLPDQGAVSATAPCCGRCTLSAQTIELFLWPSTSETPTPSVTGLLPNQTAVVNALEANGAGTYVDETGFTFISPSIYIGFTSIGARDYCGAVGTPVYNTTMAFDPTDVSSVLPAIATATCISQQTGEGGDVITWSNYENVIVTQPLAYSDVAQNCSSIHGYYWFSDNPLAGNAGDPCHPVLAIPTQVNQIQKEWNDCGAGYEGGFYDPPKTLKQGPLLVPTTANPKPTADPGQSPTTGPPKTTAPPALPETTPEPKPSTQNDPVPDPSTSTKDPQAPISSNDPIQDSSAQTQPTISTQQDPPTLSNNVPDVSNPPAPTTTRPDATVQPNPPQQSSSTTIVLNPQPANPTTVVQVSSNPSNPTLPVITLNPQSVTNNPANPNSPSNPSSLLSVPVLTLIPTIILTVPNPVNPANPSDPVGPANPADPVNPANPNPVPQSSSTAIVIDAQTLLPGGTIIIGGSTTTLQNDQTTVTGGIELVLDPQGTQVIVDRTSTVNFPSAAPVQLTAAPVQSVALVVVTVGGQTITASPSAPLVISTQTLLPGNTILVDETTLSLISSASQLVVGESTIPLTPAPQATAAPVVVTLEGTTLTTNSLTQFVIDSTTLTVDGTVTASGTMYVLTTNTQGSTMLIAGTGGVSSAATTAPTSADVSGDSTTKSTSSSSGRSTRNSTSTESGSTSGSASPIQSVPAENSDVASALRLDWVMCGLFVVRVWAYIY
jgi:hypothetical protein